ncbi:MAG: hypothetical protein VYA69_06580 [Gemmatimonadota bacterium]|nr:hypothetical protein [Gemmatimonadota bacterium]
MKDPYITEAIDLLDKHGAYDTAPAGGRLLDATGGALDTHLQSHTLTNIHKSDYTNRVVVSNLQFFNLNILNGAIIKEQAPVVTRDTERDPRSGGLQFLDEDTLGSAP